MVNILKKYINKGILNKKKQKTGDKMKTKLYINDDNFIAGITLKDETAPEQNNMALHICLKPEDVLTNRKRLTASLETDLKQLVCGNQTHSDNFYKVTKEDIGRGSASLDTAIPNTDAFYTFEPNIILTSFTADCVPVLFYNKKKELVGAVHSGWQGTVKEITTKLFQHLIQVENCNAADFFVFIGPALSQEKFEVDEDVYTKFKDLSYADEFMYFNEETNKYHIDNQLTVKRQCELIGIPSDNISIDHTCTFLSEEGFSYREDRKAGRHVSFIMRKE